MEWQETANFRAQSDLERWNTANLTMDDLDALPKPWLDRDSLLQHPAHPALRKRQTSGQQKLSVIRHQHPGEDAVEPANQTREDRAFDMSTCVKHRDDPAQIFASVAEDCEIPQVHVVYFRIRNLEEETAALCNEHA